MLPQYLWKVKVQICDKLQTSCLMKQNISCHTVRQTMLLSSLQQLLEMSATCLYICCKILTPPANCIINDTGPWRHSKRPTNASTVRHHCAAATDALAAGRLVIDRIKVSAIRWLQIWRNESGCWLLKKLHHVTCPVCGCVVLLKDEEIAWHVAHHGQQLLQQEHVAVIAAADLHSLMDKDEVREAKLWDADRHPNR